MCKNPGDLKLFPSSPGGGRRRRKEERGKERRGEGRREEEEKGGRGLHILLLLLRKCESVLISHRCGAANSDARPHATASTEEAAAGKRHERGRTR